MALPLKVSSKTDGTDTTRQLLKRQNPRGAWVAHSVKCLTFDFSSGHDLRVVRQSPVTGSTLSRESA